MKKVKIMLLAVTVLSVVGGALAFKTKGEGYKFWTCPVNKCVRAASVDYTFVIGGQDIGTVTTDNLVDKDCSFCDDAITATPE